MGGDPHFTTVDGLRYTYNGVGTHVMLVTDDDSFTLHCRLSQVWNSQGHSLGASVFTGIAGSCGNISDIVQVSLTADRNGNNTY